MPVSFENTFILDTDRQKAWALLLDIEKVADCMPGMELLDRHDDRTFRAVVSLKVGPLLLKFRGDGELYDVDSAAFASKLRAKGSDEKGRGGFHVEMSFALTPEASKTNVRVTTALSLTGSIAQYGRASGLVREIAGNLTETFSQNMAGLVRDLNSGFVDGQAGTVAAQSPAQKSISVIDVLWSLIKAKVRRWLGMERNLS